MPTLERDLFQRVVNILIPYCQDDSNRKSWIQSALYGCNVLNQIIWTGAAQEFTSALVQKLLQYGMCADDKPALIALLEGLKKQVGKDIEVQIDELILEIQSSTQTPNESRASSHSQNQTDDKRGGCNIGFSFILTLIGTIATVIATVVAVLQFVGTPQATPTPTDIFTDTPTAITTDELTATEVSENTATATHRPTDTVAPVPIAITPQIPCWTTVIIGSNNGYLVYDLPRDDSPSSQRVAQGSRVYVHSQETSQWGVWYQIGETDTTISGWIQSDKINLSESCSQN